LAWKKLDWTGIVSNSTNEMSIPSDIISARRESVLQDYNSAKAENHLRFLEENDKATSEYIFPNQIMDANTIVDKFYRDRRLVISVQKKTKVGADGLMIEIAKLLTTHIDDAFVVNPANVRIITGMSNASWEKDMIEKAPNCFKSKIFHHGKLSRADVSTLRNGLIIIDEIDTGDKEFQVLHNTLHEAGVLDVEHMKCNNNKFVLISATMIKQLYQLYQWGNLHELYKMTIPDSYIGHRDFLDLGILDEFFAMNTIIAAEKWIQEDILDNYGTDYRVHIARVNNKNVGILQNACIHKGVLFRHHTSADRLTDEEIKEFFKDPLSNHIILGVKGFFRRANLIPNKWKMRIGATHELYTKIVDYNVQIQGLVGRMTGYWRAIIEAGHKTGPHRTSKKAVEDYEKVYNEPFGVNSYQTAGFSKRRGQVTSDPTMLSPKNIANLDPIDLPNVEDPTNPKSVPFVINCSSDDYMSICKVGNEWDINSILSIIKKYSINIFNTIKNMNKNQVVCPQTDKSYDKLITAFVNAAENGGKYTWRIGNKVNIDTYQIYLDSRSHRIIVSIYYGSRLNGISNTASV
jgi:hypothetical protein